MNKVEAVQAPEKNPNSSQKRLSRVLNRIAPYCFILGLTIVMPDDSGKANPIPSMGSNWEIKNGEVYIHDGGTLHLSNGFDIKDTGSGFNVTDPNAENWLDEENIPGAHITYHGKG